MSGLLDQASAQVSRQSQQLPPSSPLQLLSELLRNAFSSLALAIGFAGLARRGRSNLSLLAELQQGWMRLRHHRLSLRRGAGGKTRKGHWRSEASTAAKAAQALRVEFAPTPATPTNRPTAPR